MIKDYEIPMPKWQISDPFGRAAIRTLRYDLKKALCERDGYRVEVEEMLKAKSSALETLAATVKAVKKQLDYSDKVNKTVAERSRALLSETEALKKRLEELERDYKALEEDHEKLLRSVTDKEAEI